MTQVIVASRADEEPIIGVITMAFANDPAGFWTKMEIGGIRRFSRCSGDLGKGDMSVEEVLLPRYPASFTEITASYLDVAVIGQLTAAQLALHD